MSDRNRRCWLAAAILVTALAALLTTVLALLVDWPEHPLAGLSVGVVVIPVALLVGRSAERAAHGPRALIESLTVAGVVVSAVAVYVLVVVGLGRAPDEGERDLVGLSLVATALAIVLVGPVRRWVHEWASDHVDHEQRSPDEAVRIFGGRMSRAVPMDELLLQLVESLRATMQLTSAEIWTGNDGRYTRAVAVPDRPSTTLIVGPDSLQVVARAKAQGPAWLQVWVPELLEGRDDRIVRAVAVAHLGELLGFIVVERPAGAPGFGEDEDGALVELARQVGLALHNVRLDSALQASLEELERRNAELAASRSRIVAAADESRRAIERNLHDGAQQHLVALAVKVGLIEQLADADSAAASAILGELRGDVQAALTELRELAHGIYPPLLRDRGLDEALRNAAQRSILPTLVEASGVGRYGSDVETTVYFCCLEAMQNAGKYAGDSATVAVNVGNGDEALWFEIVDDGAGFDPACADRGAGFVNMRDRLGAVGGDL
ncbi:MAG: histidine kinase [Ilumatobacteraceae bacterium]